MADTKTIIGGLAVLVQLASYIPYFWGMAKGKTKPHAFTWFVWGTLNAVAFGAQIVSGAGPGSWVLGVNMVLLYVIAAIGIKQGHVKYVLFDWLALSGALLAILLWWLTSNPLTAVILVCFSDAIGFLPAFRKAYFYPLEENVTAYIVGIPYYLISLFALETFILTNWLYPVVIVILDAIFIALILVRRIKSRQAT